MILQRTRKSPTRPDTEVSQTFNSGVVQIFSTRDAAPVGHSPIVECTAKCTLRYEEQRLGINRLYLSRQNQAEIVRVIRVPAPQSIAISSQDEAQTEDGRHYRIDTVQAVRSWPPALDLALRAVEHDFDNSLQGGTKDDMV
mgnify:FL=1